MVRLDEQRYGGSGVPEGTVEGEFEDRGGGGGWGGGRRGEMKGLRCGEVGGGGEVEIGPVAVQVDC